MFVWSALHLGITQLVKQDHTRMKEDVFHKEVDRVYGLMEETTRTVRIKREKTLNDAKIKVKINEKIMQRQKEIETQINSYFEV